MTEDSRRLRLRCAACGHEGDTDVAIDDSRHTARGTFVPVACDACGAMAAEPTVRPWALSEPDRRLLQALRIASE